LKVIAIGANHAKPAWKLQTFIDKAPFHQVLLFTRVSSLKKPLLASIDILCDVLSPTDLSSSVSL